jgi:hypothetical protein
MFEFEKEKRRRRRNDKNRMRAKARRIVRATYWFGATIINTLTGPVEREEWIEHFAQQNADNLAMCSCSMCGNPRRSLYSKGEERLTMQERRQPRTDEWGEE